MNDQPDTTTEGRLGEVLRDGDSVRLRYQRLLVHAPEKVWRAITESEHLHHWFPADIVGERRAGSRVSMPFWPEVVAQETEALELAGVDPDDAVLPGEIRTWEPPRLFELLWGNPDESHDVLRFELEPDGDGTRLVFTTWLSDPGPHGHGATGAGYHVCFDSLEQLLDTAAVTEPSDEAVAALQERYAALLAP